MVKIRIKCGLDVPIPGSAEKKSCEEPVQTSVALDLYPFSNKIRLRANVGVGDKVSIGQPLVYDPHFPKRVFLSSGGGTIKEIIRVEKRRLQSIVITLDENEECVDLDPLPLDCDEKTIRDAIFERGLSSHLFKRPFNRVITENDKPSAIFINAIASAPLAPTFEHQIAGENEAFQNGINFLSKIACCHLVSQCEVFDQFSNVTHHTATGPHPIGLSSVHIAKIAPIESLDDCVWTIDVPGVISIGALLGEGRYFLNRTVALTGPGFLDEARALYKVRWGGEIDSLIQGKMRDDIDRVIVGDILMGNGGRTHLGQFDTQICALSLQKKKHLFPFMRFFSPNYSVHRAYFPKRTYDFSARVLGEQRPIVDGSLYQRVMPMNIPVEALIKAIMAKDFEMALDLGLLHVVPEDFALCEYICPSKVPFTHIVETGILEYLELYQS